MECLWNCDALLTHHGGSPRAKRQCLHENQFVMQVLTILHSRVLMIVLQVTPCAKDGSHTLVKHIYTSTLKIYKFKKGSRDR